MVDEESDALDCATCTLRQAEADLWPENREAWGRFWRVGTRVAVEWGLTRAAFEALTADLSADDRIDLLDRFGVIFDALRPPDAPRET